MRALFGDWRKGIFASLMMFVVVSATASVQAATYDLVIRNGRVLDGAGNPWVGADIAINDGRFVKIGRVEGTGTREIDARGHYVTPGWIDMMDQSGSVLLKNGRAENKVLMGVTTVIAGEGGIPAPTAEAFDYFKQMEKQPISVNFGTYYAAWQARVEVMGPAAGQPTPEQMEQMKALVATAMKAGAFGMTTALIYPPSSFQSTQELISLAQVVSKYGGLYATHLRDESADLVEAVKEALEIGEQGGLAVEIFHFKAAYQPGWGVLMAEAGAVIEAARIRGLDIAADVYPYPAGGTGLDITIPNRIFADGEEEALKQLQDPAIREQLKRELAAGSAPGWSNLVDASGGWNNIVLANANSADYDHYRFKSIADIAAERGEHPADVAWDMVLAAAPKRAMALFFMMSEEDIETALNFPWTSIGSDAAATEKLGEMDALGLPHPRSYGTFPRIIAEYVKKRHVLSLPEAIRKMTSWPASRMGLYDRGLIREGLKADAVIFDYDRIEDKANWESPMALPTGIDYVLVNGVPVVVHGKHTGATPGEVLRGPGYHSSD